MSYYIIKGWVKWSAKTTLSERMKLGICIRVIKLQIVAEKLIFILQAYMWNVLRVVLSVKIEKKLFQLTEKIWHMHLKIPKYRKGLRINHYNTRAICKVSSTL